MDRLKFVVLRPEDLNKEPNILKSTNINLYSEGKILSYVKSIELDINIDNVVIKFEAKRFKLKQDQSDSMTQVEFPTVLETYTGLVEKIEVIDGVVNIHLIIQNIDG